ncbi:hypothetical protein ACOSQ3_029022 [Xanthoceras sorbifolium]
MGNGSYRKRAHHKHIHVGDTLVNNIGDFAGWTSMGIVNYGKCANQKHFHVGDSLGKAPSCPLLHYST